MGNEITVCDNCDKVNGHNEAGYENLHVLAESVFGKGFVSGQPTSVSTSDIAGRWISARGQLHIVTVEHIQWSTGGISRLIASGVGFKTEVRSEPNQRGTMHYFLAPTSDRLEWSDGDVWIRQTEPRTPVHQSVSDSAEAITTWANGARERLRGLATVDRQCSIGPLDAEACRSAHKHDKKIFVEKDHVNNMSPEKQWDVALVTDTLLSQLSLSPFSKTGDLAKNDKDRMLDFESPSPNYPELRSEASFSPRFPASPASPLNQDQARRIGRPRPKLRQHREDRSQRHQPPLDDQFDEWHACPGESTREPYSSMLPPAESVVPWPDNRSPRGP